MAAAVFLRDGALRRVAGLELVVAGVEVADLRLDLAPEAEQIVRVARLQHHAVEVTRDELEVALRAGERHVARAAFLRDDAVGLVQARNLARLVQRGAGGGGAEQAENKCGAGGDGQEAQHEDAISRGRNRRLRDRARRKDHPHCRASGKRFANARGAA